MIAGISAERWREAGTLFHELVELDETSRSERLARVGHSDPELRAVVETLLAGDAIADEVLPAPGFGFGAPSGRRAVGALGLEGQTIGRFRILEQVAWGGMGVVYRAEDTQLHRIVALKFPLLDPGMTESARAVTLREARAAGALDHPNLCPIFDIGESEHGPFFVMPLYAGETLKDRIARAPLNVSEAMTILEQLAAGLTCAHGAGIVHCDIKPGNVMLLPDGTVKLLDFGLARAGAAVSSAAGIVGTVAYMAPEQIRDEPVDARTDLWALGVILYETLSGSRPFIGDTTAGVADAVLRLKPRPLRTSAPVPASVRALVRNLLEKTPTARMQTAADLTRAIAAARSEIASRSSARSPLRRATSASAVLFGAGVLVSALWLRPPATLIGSGKLSPRDTLVLAEFEVAGLDSSVAPALTTILRRDFDDSRTVKLMPSSGMNSALERMRRAPGTRITPELAREIGRREGARAVVAGRVSPLGSGYLVTLRLIESESGNELASTSSPVVNAERDLLSAIGRADQALRGRIGESLRGVSRIPSPQRKLTTTSLEAARLIWAASGPSRSNEQKVAAIRAAIRLDPDFAYGWMSIGNHLSNAGYRSSARDSAFSIAYRLRDHLTLMERAQVGYFYWGQVHRERGRAISELVSALDIDTTLYGALPRNLAGALLETRQFERAEAFARRMEGWSTVHGASGELLHAQLALGEYAAADSTLARVSRRGLTDPYYLSLARLNALFTLRFDSAAALLAKSPESEATLSQRMVLLRLRGRFDDARRIADRLDSTTRGISAAAGARFDPSAGRTLTLAREALWLHHDSRAAVAQLDSRWRSVARIYDTQDRVDGMRAAAVYAAAGQPTKARALLAMFEDGADTIAKRGIYEYRQAALAELALADGRFSDAMRFFRASDVGADGLPRSECAVCLFPSLARVADRAGWSDSARVFWEAYVSKPSIDRLTTDQWFLAAAYARLAELAASRGDTERAATYHHALLALRAPTALDAR